MPANHRVSVGWQIVAQFIPIADLWSAYRIRKLRKYVIYVIMPNIVITAVSFYYYFSELERFTPWGDDGLAFGDPTPYLMIQIVTTTAGLALLLWSIYLIVKWSREHNSKFDSPTAQTS